MNQPALAHQKTRFSLSATPLILALLTLPSVKAATDLAEVITEYQTGRVSMVEFQVLYKTANMRRETNAYEGLGLSIQSLLRTGDDSRAVVAMSDQTQVRLQADTILEILEPSRPGRDADFTGPAGFPSLGRPQAPVVRVQSGQAYFSSRGALRGLSFLTSQVKGTPRGTEFLVSVNPALQQTQVTMLDGEVALTDGQTNVVLRSGEQGLAVTGQGITVRPVLKAENIVQWWIYYPAVLNPEDLGLSPDEREKLQNSLAAYERGDLREALLSYPAYPSPDAPTSPAQSAYLASLYLAVGSVDKAVHLLPSADSDDPGEAAARALHTMILAVSAPEDVIPRPLASPPPGKRMSATSSELLAFSYAHQKTNNLSAALETSRRAVEKAPAFGFAWARVAELEFSFGRVPLARAAMNKALQFAPHHAQAQAIQGFLLAADHKMPQALAAFDRAIQLDPALGNAWLGRGLCKRRLGPSQSQSMLSASASSWLEDLQTAAALEPGRSLVRSYLGKAFSDDRQNRLARKELDFARVLDPNDPTPWLYSALQHGQANRVNMAIADLEHSQTLNNNRAVYRSRLLLDQDAAVRSANLAALYGDNGMAEAGLRQAARGVNQDYTSFSGHLFLANSYSVLQDPGRVRLRYETAAVSEYLLANLLAPVGAGTLSPTLSLQEYSKLLQQDGLGLVSSTEYLSRGAWNQDSAVFGNFGNSSFAFANSYLHDNGQRPNEDLEVTSYSVQWKQRVAPQDHVYGQILWSDLEGGDLAPHYDSRPAAQQGYNPLVRVVETQEPIALAGYRHEWTPFSQSLLLAGFVNDSLEVGNPNQSVPLLSRDPGGNVVGVGLLPIAQKYQSEQNTASLEAQQILQTGNHTFIAGGRFQSGRFDTRNLHSQPPPPIVLTNLHGEADTGFDRASAYGYYQWQVAEPLRVQAGLSYDAMRYPANFRYAPVGKDEDSVDQWSPKAGLMWTPSSETSVLGSFARSLTGASLDQSLRLEPSQVAGLNQAYRSAIPDAVTGANSGESIDSASLLIDHRFPTRTYLGLSANLLRSGLVRDVGVYEESLPSLSRPPSTTRENLDYQEDSMAVTFNQLVDDGWSLGVTYRVSRAELDTRFKGIPATAAMFDGFQARQNLEAWLHQMRLFGGFNHPSGLFAQAESVWHQQSNQGYSPDIPGDDFWQFNLYGGWRFLNRRAEITLGILNLADQNYRLNPLNLTPDLPRDRTFLARFRVFF